METLLTTWLGNASPVLVLDGASVAEARERVRAEAAAVGLPETEREQLVLAASELAQNHLAHARGGQLIVRPLHRDGVPGVEVVAADRGNGIQDPTRALQGGPRPDGGSLGAGLATVLRQADEVDFDIRWGEGTCVWARKFAQPPAWRRQVAVLGRACKGEWVSGDHAAFVRDEHGLLCGVVDGLGHGADAREAAGVAIETFLARAELAPERILEECGAALKGTRGAVMAVGRMDGRTGELVVACGGNVSTRIWRQGREDALPCVPMVLGMPSAGGRKPRAERSVLRPSDVVVMFTDGLSSRLSFENNETLRRQHPLLIAHHLFGRYAREHDDALILVTRRG